MLCRWISYVAKLGEIRGNLGRDATHVAKKYFRISMVENNSSSYT